MRGKKILCAALACVTVASLCACGSETTSEGQTHFSVYVNSSGAEPTEDNKILAKIKNELGYDYDFEYSVSGHEDERIGVMMSSGDYPDIIEISDNKLIQAGALVPLDEYINEEDTPNLYKFLEPISKKARYSGDGHVYALPNYGGPIYGEDNTPDYWGPAFWIQKRVLAEYGYPEIKTLDQYFEIIERYVADHPETNGISNIGYEILATTGFEWVLTTAPNYLNGNPNDGDVVVDKETYEAKIYANSDFAKNYFKKLNEAYTKGIIDPECFTQNKDQYISKIASGRVIGMFDQHWVFQPGEQSLTAQGMDECTYVPLPITFDESIEPWYRVEEQMNINQGLAISINCEDPEAAVKMLDTFMSEEWQKIFQWGIEGEDYMVDENGRYYRTEEQREQQKDQIWPAKNKLNAFFAAMPKITGTYSDGNGSSASLQPEEFIASLKDYDKNFLASYGKENWMDFLNELKPNPKYFPAWNIDLVDTSDADYANQKLTDTSIRNLPQIVMSGDNFESAWSAYCSEIDTINIKAYEDRINEEIQWRIANW